LACEMILRSHVAFCSQRGDQQSLSWRTNAVASNSVRSSLFWSELIILCSPRYRSALFDDDFCGRIQNYAATCVHWVASGLRDFRKSFEHPLSSSLCTSLRA
jgi:hypothetical protein